MDLTELTSYKERILENCRKVILGKDSVIEHVIICFAVGGHVLLEDLPGTGKTMLLRSFAKSIGADFTRIQFTPDLMPSDLTGINFYNQKTGDFEFRRGPLFSSIVLADEINRATPRTQSSLLEAMEEHQITVDGTSYPLSEPFMVMATQNPIENYGTFPLPEAQTDRFLMRLHLGYMSRSDELRVVSRPSAAGIVSSLDAVVTMEETFRIRELLPGIHVSDEVASYLMDIIEYTRTDDRFSQGVSTRGAIALYKTAQAKAAFSGRDFVIPEDIQNLAVPVLSHRISQNSAAAEELIRSALEDIRVPLESV